MNSNDSEKVKLLDIQMITTIILIGAFVVNIVLAYDDKMRIINKRGIFPRNTANKIDIYNRVILAALFFVYLYLNVKDREVAERENKDLSLFNFSISSSILVLIAGLITLYVVAASAAQEQVNVQNPEV